MMRYGMMKRLTLAAAALLATPVHAEMSEPLIWGLSVNQLERVTGDGEAIAWDADFKIGRDISNLQLEAEGERALGGDSQGRAKAYYTQAVSAFWDVKAGLAYDYAPGTHLTHLALGVQGLAPQWIETEAVAYVSEDGDLTGEVTLETELLLTPDLTLVPELTIGLSAGEVPARGLGQGLTDIAFEPRLKWRAARNVQPYIGYEYKRLFGGTAGAARAVGEDRTAEAVLLGVNFWY